MSNSAHFRVTHYSNLTYARLSSEIGRNRPFLIGTRNYFTANDSLAHIIACFGFSQYFSNGVPTRLCAVTANGRTRAWQWDLFGNLNVTEFIHAFWA